MSITIIPLQKRKMLQGRGGIVHRLLLHRETIRLMKSIQDTLTEATGVSPSYPVLVSRALESYDQSLKSFDPDTELSRLRSIAKQD